MREKFELKPRNVVIEKDGKYYRINILYKTHKLHSEMLNLATAISIRDALLGLKEYNIEDN